MAKRIKAKDLKLETATSLTGFITANVAALNQRIEVLEREAAAAERGRQWLARKIAARQRKAA